MNTYFHAFRKQLTRPKRITIRKEIAVSADGLTLKESRLIAEKVNGQSEGFRYQGVN